jgi:hypothetical protein
MSDQPMTVIVKNQHPPSGCAILVIGLFIMAGLGWLWGLIFGVEEEDESTARPRTFVDSHIPRASTEPETEEPSASLAPSPTAIPGVSPPRATSLTVAQLERDLGGDCPSSTLRRGTVLQCVKTGGDDEAGLLILILDDEGNYDFDVGDTTINSTPGLFCRDLVAMETPYFYAVAYWFDQGRPARMDAEGNGIPCETVYDVTEVRAVWRNAQ